jgi:hypothetical protein
MNEESMATAVEGWGYRTFPRPEGGDFGYSRLLVAIRKQPTHHHFDPHRLHFCLRGASGKVRLRTATLDVPVEESGRVCPGPVSLFDRAEREVEFFTFGATVEVVSNPSALFYAFHSPAPILELTSPGETIVDQLAYEAQGVLARMEERWDERYDSGFAERLTEIAPDSLYVAILDSILLRYQAAPALQRAFPVLYAALEKEKKHLVTVDLWPEHPPQMEDLVFESA